jgi:pre-mRNA-splicing factor ISY1
MLHRFREGQEIEQGIKTADPRPFVAQNVQRINDCEKYRYQVMREITAKVDKIQDRNDSSSINVSSQFE